MALCIRKRTKTSDESDDIFESQAEALDELLSSKLMGTDSLEELVCSEEEFLRADPEAAEDLAEQSQNRDQGKPSDETRGDTAADDSAGRFVEADGSEEDLFQGDLISCYLQEISHYPLLSPEREIELARVIKEGQEGLVALLWDDRAKNSRFDGIRKQLRRWQDESENYPGLREKMVEHALSALEKVASKEGATNGHHQLLEEALEIARRIDLAKSQERNGGRKPALGLEHCQAAPGSRLELSRSHSRGQYGTAEGGCPL